MNEENNEYGDTISSAPKRMRCRTSSVWSDFEILPIGSDVKERAMCKKCQNSFVADSNGTTSLLRHRAKCHEVDNQSVSHQPLDQATYREMVALAIIRHNYPFSFAEHENNRLLHCYLNPDVKTICRNTAKSDVIKKKTDSGFQMLPCRCSIERLTTYSNLVEYDRQLHNDDRDALFFV